MGFDGEFGAKAPENLDGSERLYEAAESQPLECSSNIAQVLRASYQNIVDPGSLSGLPESQLKAFKDAMQEAASTVGKICESLRSNPDPGRVGPSVEKVARKNIADLQSPISYPMKVFFASEPDENGKMTRAGHAYIVFPPNENDVAVNGTTVAFRLHSENPNLEAKFQEGPVSMDRNGVSAHECFFQAKLLGVLPRRQREQIA